MPAVISAVDWELVSQKIATLRASRPTAVNGHVGSIDRMAALVESVAVITC